MNVIEFDNVSKSYWKYHEVTKGLKNVLFSLSKTITDFNQSTNCFLAVKDLSFQIKKGENVGIIGRNGAGKSTTLGMMAGVIRPTTGKIVVKERISPLLELGGGFHPNLTGFDNIKLNGVLLGLTLRQVNRKMDEIIEFSELGDFIFRPYRTYSSGMKSRLGFSVVAHLAPEIILIDEALGVGDVAFKKKCEEKIMSYKNNKEITTVIVSHSINEVQKICDRVIWINEKTIRMSGDPKTVGEAYLQYFDISNTNANKT